MDTTTSSRRSELFGSHYGLAVSLARRYSARASWADSSEDLKQVALLGLIGAIDRFEPVRGVPISAYATQSIIGELKHYLRDRSWAVRPPRRIQDLYLQSQDAISELTQEMGRLPTPAEVGDRVDASVDDVAQALEAGDLRRLPSIDALVPGDDRPLSRRLHADDEGMNAVEERMAVRWLLTRLPERERRMVRLRYIDGLTQTEIADQMSLSQAHVQRMLVRSLDHLRALAKAA